MTTRKSTKRTASPKRMYIDYTPDLQYKDTDRYSHYVPYVIYGETPRKPLHTEYIDQHSAVGLVYDRNGRRLNQFDLIEKLPRHYEVSVSKATYDRALKKIDKIATLREDADRIRGLSWDEMPFHRREAAHEVMADLARRTRMRKRRSGKTSLRR